MNALFTPAPMMAKAVPHPRGGFTVAVPPPPGTRTTVRIYHGNFGTLSAAETAAADFNAKYLSSSTSTHHPHVNAQG